MTSDHLDSTPGSAPTGHSEDLKSNFKRTVRLDHAPDGSTSLSKHFHAPGLGGLRDGWRARSEAAALREAARRGVPVPEVLGIERNGPSWTLRLQWIPAARTLEDAVAARTAWDVPREPEEPATEGAAQPIESRRTGSQRTGSQRREGSRAGARPAPRGASVPSPAGVPPGGGAPPRQGRGRRYPAAPALARSIGQLLAAIEAAGLRYPDPHAQNVLVDEAGALWLVDLARSRFAPHTAASMQSTLVRACARLRELSSPAFRALIFRAFLRARPSHLAAPDPLDIERRATLQQRQDIRRRVKVWRRDSSMTIVEQTPSKVVRARHLRDQPAAGWRTERRECSSREASAIWAHLVRAELHRLPAARPRRLALAPPYFVEFDVPEAGGAAPGAAAREALAAQLADRGLELIGSPLMAEDGAAVIPPLGRLRFSEVRA